MALNKRLLHPVHLIRLSTFLRRSVQQKKQELVRKNVKKCWVYQRIGLHLQCVSRIWAKLKIVMMARFYAWANFCFFLMIYFTRYKLIFFYIQYCNNYDINCCENWASCSFKSFLLMLCYCRAASKKWSFLQIWSKRT